MVLKIIKVSVKIFLGVIFLLWCGYLLLPGPAEIPPPPWGLRSVEPGDTWQIPGVFAYYTDVLREDIADYYFRHYSRSSFLNLPLITYKLNHPPEYAREVFKPEQQSSFFEEIVHPLRESFFVNGFEWVKDPFTKPEKRAANKFVVRKHEWKIKVTLRERYSSLGWRIILMAGIMAISLWIYREGKQIIADYKKN